MIVILIFLLVSLSFSHELLEEVRQEGNCTLVHFYFQDGSAFSYEEYEVYREGEKAPFQKGRSDALGRVVFCPDRDGLWFLRIRSQDGHGAELRLNLKAGKVEKKRSKFESYQRVLSGLGYLLGIFGLISLFSRRWKR
ncbi:hypothetical protein IAE16_05525 [Hydrogenobacter sp. T-2]|uniref:hypothetical protein n=1 Tax=Pampinifervens diazotrophicum TaxID=1632018 RepID=UPI002B2605AD|nr:hypothetical protein [Hydrogenobacter sp. T-2]WPM31284.1 hypothetical protein IAE16_05525 [Hydrogenobacter sp. T-2]